MRAAQGAFAAAGWRVAIAALAGSVFGCAPAHVRATQGRFLDRPIVWNARDQEPIAEPAERPFSLMAGGLDWFVARRLTRAMELHAQIPAQNTNALDEVPDSSWFTNRIGVRDVSPSEAARAASAAGPPVPPLLAVGGKPGGTNPGLVVKDARGRRFIIKFDVEVSLELQTAAHVILNRVFWTLGYNVPNDTVAHVFREQVGVAPGSEFKDELGVKHPLTQADVDGVFEGAPRRSDGSYRVAASEFIAGIPKGGWPSEGVRADDANDRIPHEHRREVRALRVFCAWLNHTDMKEDNTLDAYESTAGGGFLRHYLLDFGQSMGGPVAQARPNDGYERRFDWGAQLKALSSFGLWVRPQEHRSLTVWPSVGTFRADGFDPRQFKEAWAYWPFFEMDPSDAYWAAKLVMRFSREILESIVAQSQLTQPGAAAHLVDTLYRRREAIGAAYLRAVSPLDHFVLERRGLCLVDLSVAYGLVGLAQVEVLASDNEVIFARTTDRWGRMCVPVEGDESYQILRLRVRHHDQPKPPMQVHLKGGKKGRILGVVRMERG